MALNRNTCLSISKHITDLCMDRDELRVFCDLPGRRTDSEGTVPEELLSPEELRSMILRERGTRGANPQGLKPDIVFLSRSFR